MTISAHVCGERREWKGVADLGRCGSWQMAVFCVASTTYNVPSDAEGGRFDGLRDLPKLNVALRRWFD